jgi:integrase
MNGTKTEIRPGVWRLRVYAGRRANGSPVQITQTFRSEEAIKRGAKCKPGAGTRLADDKLAEMIAKANKGNAATGTETVNDLLDKFFEHRAQKLSPTTIRGYTSLADKWVRPELGKIRLSRLTSLHLDALYTKMTASGKTPATVRRAHALMSSSLVQARKWKWVESNIAVDASPPGADEVRFAVPTPDEVRAMITEGEKIEPTLAALLLLAALTGARRGELAALRFTDLDEDAATLTIARSVYETRENAGWAEKTTKSRQTRRIGLDDVSLTALRRVRLARQELCDSLDLEPLADGFIFSRSPVGAEPIGPDTVTRFAKRVAKLAGVDTHLHALRHFSASQAIGAGFDPVTVGARLGHADPSITLRVYSHVLEQRDRDLAASLGRTLALPTG